MEVGRGLLTSDETFETVAALIKSWGKEVCPVKDTPGFIYNRLMIPLVNEAVQLYYEGIASAEDIDKNFVTIGANGIGPLRLADITGIDVMLHIMNVLYEEYGDPKYRPHRLMKQMVRANLLGRKTGKGFFDWG